MNERSYVNIHLLFSVILTANNGHVYQLFQRNKKAFENVPGSAGEWFTLQYGVFVVENDVNGDLGNRGACRPSP